MRAFLARAIHTTRAPPKYLICDRGPQFDCHGFRGWCRRRNIRPRFGAIGKHGSIAVVERLILTLKQSCTRLLYAGTAAPPRLSKRTFALLRLVQRGAATHDAQWSDPRGSLTSGTFQRYASRAMNRVHAGRADLRLQNRGHSSAASLAHDWNCMLSSSPGGSTCRSSRCAARRSRRPDCWDSEPLRSRCAPRDLPGSQLFELPMIVPRRLRQRHCPRLENPLNHRPIYSKTTSQVFTQQSLDYDRAENFRRQETPPKKNRTVRACDILRNH